MTKIEKTCGNVVMFPGKKAPRRQTQSGPTAGQREWLARGLSQPGGKLPLFDREGQPYPQRTIRSCIAKGWAEPWFNNPLKRDWLVCRLTDAGRSAAKKGAKG